MSTFSFTVRYDNSAFSETLQTFCNTGERHDWAAWLDTGSLKGLVQGAGTALSSDMLVGWVDFAVCKHTDNLLLDLTLSQEAGPSFCRCPVCRNAKVCSLRQASLIGTQKHTLETETFLTSIHRKSRCRNWQHATVEFSLVESHL